MSETRMIVRGRLVRYIAEDDYRAPVDRVPDFPEATEQAWWNEHRFTQEFWRNAEPVSDSKPPEPAALDKDFSTVRDAAILAGVAFAAGLIVALGVAYVLLRLVSG